MAAYYLISSPSQVRTIAAETIAAWQASGNPKLLLWALQPAPPSADAIWQNGEWVAPPPPEPPPEWIGFSEAVVAIDAVKQVLAAAFTANPGLYGGLVVGLGQAAQGDPRTFLRFWQLSISAGLIQPGLAQQIQSLAANYNLPAEFVSGLQSPGLPPIEPGGVQNLGGLGTQILVTNPLPPQ